MSNENNNKHYYNNADVDEDFMFEKMSVISELLRRSHGEQGLQN